MGKEPTYEELQKKVKELEQEPEKCIQVEDALWESERRFRLLAESLVDTVYQFDPKGKFTYVNEAGVRMLGYSKDELLGNIQVRNTMSKEDCARSREAIGEIFKGKTIVGERTFIRKDGTTFIGEIHSGPIYKGKDVIGVRGVLRDITERKQAAAKIKAYSENLERMVEERTKELVSKTNKLEEINIALNVLLNKREEDKILLQEQVLSNVKKLSIPYIEKLKKSKLNEMQIALIDVIESSLHEIVSPFSLKLSSESFGLTPTEIKVADLIRQGNGSKEVAAIHNLSPKTVERHRESIRNKIGIKNKKINLQSYLSSL